MSFPYYSGVGFTIISTRCRSPKGLTGTTRSPRRMFAPFPHLKAFGVADVQVPIEPLSLCSEGIPTSGPILSCAGIQGSKAPRLPATSASSFSVLLVSTPGFMVSRLPWELPD